MTRNFANALYYIVTGAMLCVFVTYVFLAYFSPETLVSISCNVTTDNAIDQMLCTYANRPAR